MRLSVQFGSLVAANSTSDTCDARRRYSRSWSTWTSRRGVTFWSDSSSLTKWRTLRYIVYSIDRIDGRFRPSRLGLIDVDYYEWSSAQTRQTFFVEMNISNARQEGLISILSTCIFWHLWANVKRSFASSSRKRCSSFNYVLFFNHVFQRE